VRDKIVLFQIVFLPPEIQTKEQNNNNYKEIIFRTNSKIFVLSPQKL